MSRKRNIVCLLFVMLLTMSSCSWLDVSPSNEVNEEDMFSKGDGYRNALNGLYLKLSESSFYGRNLSWGYRGTWSAISDRFYGEDFYLL